MRLFVPWKACAAAAVLALASAAAAASSFSVHIEARVADQAVAPISLLVRDNEAKTAALSPSAFVQVVVRAAEQTPDQKPRFDFSLFDSSAGEPRLVGGSAGTLSLDQPSSRRIVANGVAYEFQFRIVKAPAP